MLLHFMVVLCRLRSVLLAVEKSQISHVHIFPRECSLMAWDFKSFLPTATKGQDKQFSSVWYDSLCFLRSVERLVRTSQ